MKKWTWTLPLIGGVVLLFLWTVHENFEDTATVHGPPYGNTPATARQLINLMSPTLLASIKAHMKVTSEPLSDRDAVKVVHGSPIAQIMSSFYWQVYKPATVTIDIVQVNNFLGLQTNSWLDEPGNRAGMRDFLTTYFIRGQNGGAQSGYLDVLNTVWGSSQITAANAPAPTEAKPTPSASASSSTNNTIIYVSIGIAVVSVFAVLIVLLLPQRNVL
jgi:hypothetical protein